MPNDHTPTFTIWAYIEEHDPQTDEYTKHEPQELIARYDSEDIARRELTNLAILKAIGPKGK